MPELIAPTVRLHDSWLESLQEWGSGVHQDGAGLHSDVDVESAEGFAAWVEWLCQQNDPTIPLPAGRVPTDYWWIVDGETYLGAITLRHELNDFLLEQGGHIGYGVRPAARRRGLATWALGEVLQRARQAGLRRVLITCDGGNEASARTIERHGGRLEDVRVVDGDRAVRRYWVDLV
jgi:predicted acetyltransferase